MHSRVIARLFSLSLFFLDKESHLNWSGVARCSTGGARQPTRAGVGGIDDVSRTFLLARANRGEEK